MIDTQSFSAEWVKIENKLDQISGLGFQEGNTLDGYTIDTHGITIKSSQYFSGCGTDYYSYYVSFEDINKPISFFQKLLDAKLKTEKDRKVKAAEDEKERIRQSEIRQLKELPKKHGIIP